MSAAALYCTVSNVTAFIRPLAVFRFTMFLDEAWAVSVSWGSASWASVL